ncbi:MAG: molybdenum cofactor guanylyltransferase MobA [Alphaproteobacteria bacterium]
MTGIAGILLAGGQARRMGGGDKCLRQLGGKTLLAHAIARLAPQVGPLLLNANGDPARFAEYGLPVAADVVEGFAGPLAGILTGLEWAQANAPDCPWLVSAPTDAPFLPADLVQAMKASVDEIGADLACAMSHGRSHPVVGLWPVRLAGELREALVGKDIRKIDVWTARYRLATVEFPGEPVDPFFNANRPEDLAEAERLLATVS